MAQTHASASFSTVEYFLSAVVRVREAKATVLSELSACICVRTPPIPYSEASVVTIVGSSGLKRARAALFTISPLTVSKLS